MQLSIHIESLREDLSRIAGVGSDEIANAARRVAEALESSIRLRLVDVLSEAALELSNQLQNGHVEVRLAGREPELVYVEEEAAAAPAGGDEGMHARITLRLPESLKTAAEAAANREGVSLNTWLVRAIGRATEGGTTRARQTGRRLTGFAQD